VSYCIEFLSLSTFILLICESHIVFPGIPSQVNLLFILFLW